MMSSSGDASPSPPPRNQIHLKTSLGVSSSTASPSGSQQTSSSAASGSDHHHSNDRITLVVDNTRFIVDPVLFTAHPDTMLGRMFGGNCSGGASLITRPNERGEFEVADGVSATVFRAILVSSLVHDNNSRLPHVSYSSCLLSFPTQTRFNNKFESLLLKL
jgi:BTB/POZ domain-containing protein 10